LRPWFWPEHDRELSEEIWVTEGESDTGVLRHLGFKAFGLTKGAQTVPPPEVWRELWEKGTRRVIFSLDQDQAGEVGRLRLIEQALESGFEVILCDFKDHLNFLSGEKDIRDLYKREGARTRELLLQSLKALQSFELRLSLWEFLTRGVSTPEWLVERVWLSQTVGLLVGPSKTGKSWLALDLGLSVATGTKFLSFFSTPATGTVVYIPKEDPPYLLYDRVTKILLSKGLGSVNRLPKKLEVPWFTDLSYTFAFEKTRVSGLLKFLRDVRDRTGSLDLVIFDPLLRMLPPGVDEWKAGSVSDAVFSVTDQIRNELGTSVLLVHHRGHGKEERAYGSFGFQAFSEGTLVLLTERLKLGEWNGVRGEYKSAPPTEWAYRFLDLQDSYEPEGTWGLPEPTRLQAQGEEVLELLNVATPPVTLENISVTLGIPKWRVRDILESLEEQGKIEKVVGDTTAKGRPRVGYQVKKPREGEL